MPKKSKPESPEEQSERFRREAQRLIDAGELDPEKGREALEKLIKSTTSSAKSGTSTSTKS